jgi:hypothetical protein
MRGDNIVYILQHFRKFRFQLVGNHLYRSIGGFVLNRKKKTQRGEATMFEVLKFLALLSLFLNSRYRYN